jgi:hypothetical protein
MISKMNHRATILLFLTTYWRSKYCSVEQQFSRYRKILFILIVSDIEIAIIYSIFIFNYTEIIIDVYYIDIEMKTTLGLIRRGPRIGYININWETNLCLIVKKCNIRCYP